MKKFIFACKKLFLLTLLSASAVSTYAAYVISVYKDGWSANYEFTQLSGSEYICENIVISDYTGNPSNYRYWIGNGAWEDGKSANFNLGSSNSSQGSVSGTDYISSCSTGVFSVKIYTDSGDKNYYPHDMTCGTAGCSVQDKGDAIPANTVIFFDNSNGAINTGSIYISVPSESTNGNSTSLNQGSYVPKNDNWYPMTNMGNNIWRAVITTASSYGRMSFWGNDLSTYDDVWQSIVAFQIPYTSGKNAFAAEIPSDGLCYNSDRQTSYYVSGTWTTRAGLDLMASAYSMKESDTDPITLTASAVGISGSTYKFEYRSFDSSTWKTLATQSGSTYTLSGASLPGQTTYYRVTYGSHTSDEIRIAVIVECNAASTKNLLKFDYGTFSSLTGTTSRTSSNDMSSDYTFKEWPGKVNDGYYAIVPTPYYCGCGGSGSGCNESDDVTLCKGCNDWFRDLGDHSNPTHSSAPYGGMLFINFDQNKSQIAYEHDLTEAEKSNFVKGSTLSFSAWFASATTKNPSGGTNIPINMKLSIQYKATGSTSWETRASIATQVAYDDGWQQGVTSIDISDTEGDYRVIIENNAASGVGNDVLIDDVSLDLCIPEFNIEYYNESTSTSYTEYTYEDINHSELIRIPKKDYGFGNDNCVMLFAVDESKSVGQAGRFKYVASMDLDNSGENYVVTQTAVELMDRLSVLPDYTGKLQAIITESTTCTDSNKKTAFILDLQDGNILPFPEGDASVLSSTNMLTFTINCMNGIAAALTSTNPVCETDGKKDSDLPSISVTFDNISNLIDYTLVEDAGTATEKTLISHRMLHETYVSAKSFLIDLNDVEDIVRTPGNHTFTVTLTEYKVATTQGYDAICEKSTSAGTLVVKNKPAYNKEYWPTEIDYCFEKSITVDAEYTTTYQWYVDKSEAATTENWEAIEGATSATYNLPVDLKDGWRYKVELSNEYCTVVTTNPVRVSRVSSDAPTTKNYEKCAVKTSSQIIPLSDLVTSQYTLLTWYKEDKTTVVSPAQFDASVATEAAVTYYVTDTRSQGCESEPSVVTVFVKPNAANPIAVTPYYNECFDENVTELDLNTLFDYNTEYTYKYLDATGSALNNSIVSVATPGSTTYSVIATYNECASDPTSIPVTVIAVSDTPEIVEGGYNECAVDGTKALADLVTSDKTELHWYDASDTEIIPAEFSTSTPVSDAKYYVTNTESGKCVSKKAEASVTVRVNSEEPITKNYKDCLDPSVSQLDLLTLVTNAKPTLTYNFYDAAGNPLPSSYADISTPGSTDYSVVAVADGCLSDKVGLTVKVKDNATASDITVNDQEVCKGATATFSASTATVLPSPIFTWYSDADLTDKISTGATMNITVEEDRIIYVTVQNDDYCENAAGDGAEASLTAIIPISSVVINPAEESIVLGDETSKTLVVDPAEAEYTVTWTANGVEISADAFPARPYLTQNYEATLVDACNNTHKATAVTNVEWPTVFMPYDQSSTNRDFVVDIDEGGIELLIFDRSGNTMAHTYNGWDGTVKDGSMAMPGVYFYKAILPDGSIKLGTVEIRKK